MIFWDFTLPARTRALEARLGEARATLARQPESAAALATIGEWYAFRGVSDWALELLERARKGGAPVSALALGRSYWERSDFEGARRAFQGRSTAVRRPLRI